jgi:phage baseplate assembly protein W
MSAGAITLADIQTANWSLALDGSEGGALGAGIGNVVEDVADIDQCIQIIISTPLGSDPLRPTFGLDEGLYVDVPIAIMANKLVGPAKIALETWEPRITVDRITISQDPENLGHVTVTVNWRLKASPTQQFTTTVIL